MTVHLHESHLIHSNLEFNPVRKVSGLLIFLNQPLFHTTVTNLVRRV